MSCGSGQVYIYEYLRVLECPWDKRARNFIHTTRDSPRTGAVEAGPTCNVLSLPSNLRVPVRRLVRF